MHNYEKCAFPLHLYDLVYVSVFLGDTWKDGSAMDNGHEEGIEGVVLECGLRRVWVRVTGKNEV